MLRFGIEFADSDLCKTLKTVFLAGGLTLAAVGFSRWFSFMACGVAKAKPARDGLSRCRAARAVAVLGDPSGDSSGDRLFSHASNPSKPILAILERPVGFGAGRAPLEAL